MPQQADPALRRRPRNTVASILARVEPVDPDEPLESCWRFRGHQTTKGYARVTWAYRRQQVHRLLFELAFGAVERDSTMDHICRRRWCVNPGHVEPVTNRENILRGVVPTSNRALCKNGLHDVTDPDSIYVDSEGVHRCRECRRESKRAHYRRAKT